MTFAMWLLTVCSALPLVAVAPTAAPPAGSVYESASILEIGHRLAAQLRKSGEAAGILEQKLNDSTQIAVRVKNGRAEFHQNSSDVFFVLEGSATLISGGTIVNPQGTAEIRGDSIEGGTHLAMHPGDVVQVPFATPHQVMVLPGDTFLYVVVKVPGKD